MPVGNAASIAVAIASSHDDPALAQRFGAAARGKALAQFDERIVIERILWVYQELKVGA